MNQEKIGKFIAKKRKEKNLTQQELAEKLGVTDRSISNWENGKCMPDLSLFNPLCTELGITINEFLAGEELKKENYQEKLEENIINTINYTTKKDSINLIITLAGLLLTLLAMTIIPSESSWGSIYSILGCFIALYGLNNLLKSKLNKKTLFNISYIIIYLLVLLTIDYVGTININQAPRFVLSKETTYNMIIYKKTLLNIYRINPNTKNEYYLIDWKKVYNKDTVPNVPFNRTKSGIDNIIKYKSKYLGDNSNTNNLVNNLPLSEYGKVIELDSKNLGLTINYYTTAWYINNDYYLERSLLYNSVAIFSLIDNVKYINYNFTGTTYTITKEEIENNYPKYQEIQKSKSNFNKYLESKITNDEFIHSTFEKLFQEKTLGD